ncbi:MULTISPECIES: hypothetical protein [unclassified Streptomyces]|uniref:hypothetical protein n=1 Tax=unclassified Streptomyces TaxID=2593676 RepID=UPI00136BD53B|nr:hypothetical protein [Streptomyces sp. SID6139]MYR23845.1 hypothetical protein [Streptomyces sp. SID6137]
MRDRATSPVPEAPAAARRRQIPGPAPQFAAGRAPQPGGLAALQRTVGNAAVTRYVQRVQGQGGPGVREEARRHAADPTTHGEWDTFRDMMDKVGFPQEVTDAAWQLILGGIAEQGQLNDEALAMFTERQKQRDHRASNSWYQELVRLVGDYLEIDRPTMALWSGGIDTSVYARSKGHTPLESTPFGSVVNELQLTMDWMLKTPMWNVLSKAFVTRARGPVHIFLRAYNPDSVLIAQEVPQLRVVMALNPAVELVWHPVYTTADGKLMEVTEDLELVSDATYRTRDLCVRALYDYLRLKHDQANSRSERANAEMGARLASNGNQP